MVCVDLMPIDRIMLRALEIGKMLEGYGLHVPRVVGWAGAGKALPGPAEIQVDLPEVTDLTGGDLARLGHEISGLVGIEILVWAERPGEARVLPGERIRYL